MASFVIQRISNLNLSLPVCLKMKVFYNFFLTSVLSSLSLSLSFCVCIRVETWTTSNQEFHSEMLSNDDKSNLLILLSLDRTMPRNPVCLNVLQDVFIEFSEDNVSARRPLSEPLISWRRPTGRNVNLTEFNKNILQYIKINRVHGHCSIRRQ